MKIAKLSSYITRAAHNTVALTLFSALLITSLFTSCNSTEKDDPDYQASVNLAVKELKLRADSKVMANLDQVFFSIDLKNGVIFNADSLPMGTPIHSLSLNITFAETPDMAEIEFIGGKQYEGTVDYKKNPTDTIDCTGRVVLTVGIGEVTKSYRIKVNVHQQNPDSLVWSRLEHATLPSRLGAPVSQKSVAVGDDKVLCCIHESDGSFTLAKSININTNSWDKQAITLPADPDISSFSATSEALYILDTSGKLYSASYSDTGVSSWEDTGEIWSKILGPYQNSILGLSSKSGKLMHARYPGHPDFQPVAASFPVKESSNMAVITSKWAAAPTAMISGGRLADGSISKAIWGYDGNSWALLAESDLVARAGASMVPYYSYRVTSSTWVPSELPAWLLIGGIDATGQRSREVMISYDNCLNWRMGGDLISLPTSMPVPAMADAVVSSLPASANLSDAWTKTAIPALGQKRLQYEIDGTTITWHCPYIYIIGGNTSDSALQNNIWRGVLSRLTFTPLI